MQCEIIFSNTNKVENSSKKLVEVVKSVKNEYVDERIIIQKANNTFYNLSLTQEIYQIRTQNSILAKSIGYSLVVLLTPY